MPRTDLAISFFTILTVLANTATLGIGAVAAASRVMAADRPDHPARRAWLALRAELARSGMAVAWLVAAVATAGSLYFSEVAGFVPCRLCWIQRAAMYPLVGLLAAASVTRLGPWSQVGRALGLAFGGGGVLVASYHLLMERFPSLASGACDASVPCSLVWFERLGFVTLPYMALSAFLLIAVLLIASPPHPSATAPSVDETSTEETRS